MSGNSPSLQNPSYATRLKDPRWQRRRTEILVRDDFTCVICASKAKSLHVHHVIYTPQTAPWDYPDHCFQTLCEDCHAERQALTDKIANAVKLAIKDYPTARLLTAAQKVCSQAMIQMEV